MDYGGQSQTVSHSFRQLPSRNYKIVYNSKRRHPSSLFLSLALGLVLGTELVLDLGLGSLSIFFIVGY